MIGRILWLTGISLFFFFYSIPLALADITNIIPVDRELQHNKYVQVIQSDDPEFVAHPDGQWWPDIGYITLHDMPRSNAMQFDLSEFSGQQFSKVRFRFYVNRIWQMLDTYLATYFYETDVLLSTNTYTEEEGEIIAGHHMYAGDILLEPAFHFESLDAQPLTWNDVGQWVTYDVTDLVNNRRSDFVFFNLRFEGEPPADPNDYQTGWGSNIMLYSETDMGHYVQIASAENQPDIRPQLELQTPVIYPTVAPPSSSATDILVRGKEYTAVGYDYSSILAYGQEFQNCVFDPTTGYLYVIDNNNDDQGEGIGETDQILIIDPGTGIIVNGFNTPLARDHSYVLTMAGNGNLIFAERGHTPIYEISTDGTVTGEYSIDIETPPAPWPGVQRDGMAYNPNTNTYYITETNFSRVTRDTAGNFIKHELYETTPYDCLNPRGIVYEANNNSLLIIDDSSDRIYEFGLDGTYIAGGDGETRTVEMPEDITMANGIAFDPDTGRIFITGARSRSSDPIKRAKFVVLTPVEPIIPEVTEDLDHNGAVNNDDLLILRSCINQPASCNPAADIDGNGWITILDARKLLLTCDRPRCATNECYSFTSSAPSLDVSQEMNQVSALSFFEYTAGPDHSTSVSFDLFIDGSLFAYVGPIPVGGSSGPIFLPVHEGSHTVELRNVTCPAGEGSCVDGTIDSWGGTICITP